MNYEKLDAALAGEVGEAAADDELQVFIHTAAPLEKNQQAQLQSLGVSAASPSRQVLTASVSAAALERVSELPWVQRIALARKLRPLSGGE